MPTPFRELSRPAQVALVATGGVQVALLVAARRDLAARGDDEINGSRRVWSAVTWINLVGPLSYLRWGRRARSTGR